MEKVCQKEKARTSEYAASGHVERGRIRACGVRYVTWEQFKNHKSEEASFIYLNLFLRVHVHLHLVFLFCSILCYNCTTTVSYEKDEVINMTRAWDKEPMTSRTHGGSSIH